MAGPTSGASAIAPETSAKCPRRFERTPGVTDNGAAEHRAGTGADRLREAGADQLLNGRRENAGERSEQNSAIPPKISAERLTLIF